VSGRSLKDADANAALSDFGRRFPPWMWRNEPTARFVEWLKAFNEAHSDERPPCGFYGLDLYSLHHSARQVISYLEGVDKPAAREAREAYEVLMPYEHDMVAYGRAMAQGRLTVGHRHLTALEIQKRLEGVLTQLQRRNEGRYEYELRYTAEQRLDAEINAEIVVNAETYYRDNWHQLGHVTTWNNRDQHMVQVLLRLEHEMKSALTAQRPTQTSKMVVWAHNSHVGDVRATLKDARAERLLGAKWSLGHLVRETFGRTAVYSIGMSTHEGSVTAASQWGQPGTCWALNAALPGSQGEVLHQVLPHVRQLHEAPRANAFWLAFADRGCPAAALADRAADEHRSAWSQGDPAAAAAKRAAAAASPRTFSRHLAAPPYAQPASTRCDERCTPRARTASSALLTRRTTRCERTTSRRSCPSWLTPISTSTAPRRSCHST